MLVCCGYSYFVHSEGGEISEDGGVLVARDIHMNGVGSEGFGLVGGTFARLQETFIKNTQGCCVDGEMGDSF